MEFVKMHGLSNDFVVVGSDVSDLDPPSVREICDRRTGVGADGVLRLTPVDPGRVRMEYWNADGTTAEMCGNGLRCIARRALDLGLVDGQAFVVETAVGERRVRIENDDLIATEIGSPRLGESFEVAGVRYQRVDVGNPHAVRLVDDVRPIDVIGVGESLQNSPIFPDGVNVEFVTINGSDEIEMRVWERGVGETMACGTGMVAAAAAVMGQGHPDPTATGSIGPPGSMQVLVPGGRGTVEIHEDGTAWLTGPAITVFSGQFTEPF